MQKFLLIFLILFSIVAKSQLSNISLTQIDTSGIDMFRWGVGLNDYNGLTPVINWPNPAVSARGPDLYIRIQWAAIQTGPSSFNWSDFDSKYKNGMDRGQKVIFGFASVDDSYGGTTAGGKTMAYPLFVHNAMQAEVHPDWVPSGSSQWVPNWNSPSYLNAWDAWMQAVRTHLNTVYNGRQMITALFAVDIRGFGNYGEWHLFGAGHGTVPPTGTAAADTSLERIVNAHVLAFPTWPLLGNINMLNGANSSSDVSTAFGYWFLTHSNSWGPFGLRWDHACDKNTFDYDYTNNVTTMAGLSFKTEIGNRWKAAPVVGEPQQFNFASAGQCDYWHTMTEARTYHASMIENANNIENGGPIPSCTADLFRSIAKAMGYRLTIQAGSQVSDSLRTIFTAKLNWANIGIAPVYEHYSVTFELRQAGVVKWSGLSNFQPQFFLPGVFTQTDNLTLPTGLSGLYDLYLVIRDPANVRLPLPLQITGRQADGAYPLKLGMAVATAGSTPPPPPPPPPNNPPSVFAGSDQTDTLPKNIDTLVALVSDIDLDPVTVSWVKLSGPAVTITSPSSTTTTITGLTVGTYVFRITGNDGKGGITSDDVTVFVFNGTPPPPPPPPPPVYNPPIITAGLDSSVQLPADSAILHGTIIHKDTLIQSYKWIKFSGPSVTILTSDSLRTHVAGMVEGTYQFRLTVVDKAGNSVEDFVTIIVKPIVVSLPPPPPPTADPEKMATMKKPE